MTDTRMDGDGSSRTPGLSNEVETETTALVLVKSPSCDKLRFGFRVEGETCHRSAVRALRKTLSPARLRTFPERISSSRASASSAHSLSTSESV